MLTQTSSAQITRSLQPVPGDGFAEGVAYARVHERIFNRGPKKTLGKYQLEKRIGAGGMGSVYKAFDPELRRSVAIKIVGSSWTGTDVNRHHQALRRDAQAAAKVEHPNVVTIYDIDFDEDQLFVVMELVPGSDLNKWLDATARSWREIVEMFLQAGKGLAAVHANNLVHLDLKPANILVAGGKAKIADFGLARMLVSNDETGEHGDHGSLDSDLLRVSSEFCGTPRFMAPEQFSFSSKKNDIGPKADQFAFCVSLYYALFKTFPFEGRTIPEIDKNVHTQEPKPPPARHGVPRPLIDTLLRGLSRDPDGRFRSMEELLAHLQACIQRGRRRVQMALYVGMVASGIIIGKHWLASNPSTPCDSAETLLDNTNEQQVREILAHQHPNSPQLVETGIAQLNQYSESWKRARHDACADTEINHTQSSDVMALRMACLDRQREVYSYTIDRLADQPWTVPQLASTLDTLSKCTPEFVRKIALSANAYRSTTDRTRNPKQWEELATRIDKAWVDGSLGDHNAAYDLATVAEHDASTLGFEFLQAKAMHTMAANLYPIADNESLRTEALNLVRQAGPIALKSGGDELFAELNLSEIEFALSSGISDVDLEEKLELAHAAAHRAGALPEQMARIEIMRGNLHLHRGNRRETIDLLRELTDSDGSFLDELGASHPIMVGAQNNLAHTLRLVGRNEEARQHWKILLKVIENNYGMDHGLYTQILLNLGVVEEELGEVEVASRRYGKVEELLLNRIVTHDASSNSSKTKQSPCIGEIDDRSVADCELLAETRYNLSISAYDRGDYERAALLIDTVVSILERLYGPQYAGIAAKLDTLAEIELRRGRLDLALQAAKRELQIAEVHPDVPAIVGRSYLMVGKVLLEQGSTEEALEYTSRAVNNLQQFDSEVELQAEAAYYHARSIWTKSRNHDSTIAEVRRAMKLLDEVLDKGSNPSFTAMRQEMLEWTVQEGLSRDG
ncbi:MAG: serine/threonine-protein kinase [Myxococcota bacterium]